MVTDKKISKEASKELGNFLKETREAAGLSQQEVADKSSTAMLPSPVTQRVVSRIERNPLSIDAPQLTGYLRAVGIPHQEFFTKMENLLYGVRQTTMTQTPLTSQQVAKISKELQELIEAAFEPIVDNPLEYVDQKRFKEAKKNAMIAAAGLNRKPVIGFFGQFDSGKSTLINTIIGTKILPTKYQPATSVVNILMHIDDRPDGCTSDVLVFRKGFLPHMITELERVVEYTIAEGGLDTLNRFGVHNYNEEDEVANEAYITVVFYDSDILKAVWLADTPGDLNSSDDTDTEKALAGVEFSDAMIFLSSTVGFLKDTDLTFAQNVLRNCPPIEKKNPLENILFIQSHAHDCINEKDAKLIGKTAIARLKKQLDETVFLPWEQAGAIAEIPTAAEISEHRVLPFWKENQAYREAVCAKVLEMAEYLTENHTTVVTQNASRIKQQAKDTFVAELVSLENKKKDVDQRIKEAGIQDARFHSKSRSIIKEFKRVEDSCNTYRKEDLENLTSYTENLISEDNIAKLIYDNYDDKKSAKENLGGLISQLLAAKLETRLKTSGYRYSNDVEKVLEKWQEIVPTGCGTGESVFPVNTDSVSLVGFDARAAFLGGMVGLGSLGAMALYVSTIASNLGAYILVGKVAGILVSLGLVGSVTTVTTFVSMIGGPITIGIAMAAILGSIAYAVFGGSWQRSLAEKVHKAIVKTDPIKKIEEVVNKFWSDTKVAANKGFESLLKETDEHRIKVIADAEKVYDKGVLNASTKSFEAIVKEIEEKL